MAFAAGPVPTAPDPEFQPLVDLLWQLLEQLEVEFQFFNLDEWNTEPAGAIDGMTVFADGTNWNPGSGRGLYRFNGASWEKL